MIDDDTGKPRKRAKSRSPTPPPALSQIRKAAVQTIVRDHFETKSAVVHPSSASGQSRPTDSDSQDSDLTVKPGSAECVTIKVKWEPHPYDENAASLSPEIFTFYHHRVRLELFCSPPKSMHTNIKLLGSNSSAGVYATNAKETYPSS